MFLQDEMNNILEKYNKALGEGGNAQEIISDASVSFEEEIVENSMQDSILNQPSISGEEISIDSKEFIIIKQRRDKRMITLQFIWIIMAVVSIILALVQFLQFLTTK